MITVPDPDGGTASVGGMNDWYTGYRAACYLNYAGDQAGLLGEVLGPNLLGEWLVAVTCEHDTETDRSRVGLAYAPVPRNTPLELVPMYLYRDQLERLVEDQS